MKKFAKKSIYSMAIKDILLLNFLSIFFIISIVADIETIGFDIEGIYLVLFFVGLFLAIELLICLFSIIYSIFYNKCSGYELTQNHIVCKRGVIFKKTSQLEYKNIHSINKKQDIIAKLFNVSSLIIDSGSTNTASTGEILIIEYNDVVDQLIKEVEKRRKGEVEEVKEEEEVVNEELCFELATKKTCLYSTIVSIFAFFICAAIVLTAGIVVLSILKFVQDKDLLMQIVLITFAMSIGINIIIYPITLIAGICSLYKFKVSKVNDEIKVEKGFFVRDVNTFKVEKIKSIRIRQNIIQKLFKVSSIYADVVGFVEQTQNNNGSSSYRIGQIAPIIKDDEIDDLINKIAPEYIVKDKTCDKAPKLFPFVSYTLLFGISPLTFVLLILNIIVQNSILLMGSIASIGVIVLITFLLGILAKKNHGLYFDEDKVVCINGVLEKQKAIILDKNLIGIETYTTKYRKKDNIYSYVVHFYANSESNHIVVRNIVCEDIEKLEKVVKY